MATRKASSRWEGDLKGGSGTTRIPGCKCEVPYSFVSRFEEGDGTNPEELIAAAHSGCYSMALSHGLSQAGHQPKSVETTATVHLEKGPDGFEIPKIEIDTVADIPGIAEEDFRKYAEDAKNNCPVSKLLKAAEITLKAKLMG